VTNKWINPQTFYRGSSVQSAPSVHYASSFRVPLCILWLVWFNGKSHHPQTTFKSILFGETIRMRRLNQRKKYYLSSLSRLKEQAIRSNFPLRRSYLKWLDYLKKSYHHWPKTSKLQALLWGHSEIFPKFFQGEGLKWWNLIFFTQN